MTKWEYKVCVYPELTENGQDPSLPPESVEAMLNRLGAEGWELVMKDVLAFRKTPEFKQGICLGTLVFKRPLRN